MLVEGGLIIARDRPDAVPAASGLHLSRLARILDLQNYFNKVLYCRTQRTGQLSVRSAQANCLHVNWSRSPEKKLLSKCLATRLKYGAIKRLIGIYCAPLVHVDFSDGQATLLVCH
jgi:hypothetical protein